MEGHALPPMYHLLLEEANREINALVMLQYCSVLSL
jgi:hypothetical protein